MSNETESEIVLKRQVLIELEAAVSSERTKLNGIIDAQKVITASVHRMEARENELSISLAFLEKSVAEKSDSLARLRTERNLERTISQP